MASCDLTFVPCLRQHCNDIISIINSYANYHNPTGLIAWTKNFNVKSTDYQQIKFSDEIIVASNNCILSVYLLSADVNSNDFVKYDKKCDGFIRRFFIVGKSIVIQSFFSVCEFSVISVLQDKKGLSDDLLNLNFHSQIAGDRYDNFQICDVVATREDVILMMVTFSCGKEGEHNQKFKILKLSRQFEIISVVDLNWLVCRPPTICCNRELHVFVCFGDNYGCTEKRMVQQISSTGDRIEFFRYTCENTARLKKIYFTPFPNPNRML